MSVGRFRFRTRWPGYDRTEVNRFLDQVAADRQYLKDKLNYLESSIAKQDRRQPDGNGALPERGADEPSVRAALDAKRRQFDRLKDLSGEMATCINASVSVLQKVHEQIAVETVPAAPSGGGSWTLLTGLEGGQSAPNTSAAEPANQATSPESTRATRLSRPIAHAGLAVLAVGGAVVAAAVAHAPASMPQTSTPVVQQMARASRPEEAIPPRPAVPTATVPEGADVTPASAEDPSIADKGLVVMVAASSTCWIRSVVDGSHPVERLMQPGDAILVWGRDEVLLRAGNGAALTVMINGQAAVPLGRAGQAVTRRITRAKPKLSVQEQA